MFRRLILENWMSLFTIIAFFTATSVYVTIFYRALRMKRTQLDQLASMPLQDDDNSSHE